MLKSLQVDLNEGSVHAIDAPRSFTAEGPFHIVFNNMGGAVHVHLHLDDDLSRVSRVDEVNHYVEDGATKRVPIGVLPDRRSVTGRLKIVSGYGAEVSYVDLTIVPNKTGGEGAGATSGDGGSNQRNLRATQSVDGSAPEVDEATGATVVRRKTPTKKANRGSSTILANLSIPGSTVTDIARKLRIDDVETVVANARRGSLEAVAFLALSAVAILVGLGVILLVSDVVLALVVIAVVAATIGVAGWLLLE